MTYRRMLPGLCCCALLTVLTLCGVQAARADVPDPLDYQGRLYDLGPDVQPSGIYEEGTICAFYEAEYWAFYYPPFSDRIAMPPVTDAVSAAPHAINNNDEIVGTLTMDDGSTRGFVWSPLEDEDSMTVIGTGDNAAGCLDINDGGTVVGRYNFFEAWPSKWEPPYTNTPANLGSLGGSGEGEALGINNGGDVVGWSQNASGTNEAFVRAAGPSPSMSATDLSALGAVESSEAVDINDAGHVIGNAVVLGAGDVHQHKPFVIMSPAVAIEGLGGDETEVYALNNDDWIVGRSQTVSGVWHAAITAEDDWEAPNAIIDIIDLNTFLSAEDADHWVLECATDVNDRGWIVGWGTYDGQPHGFMMTPEPATLALLAFGGAGLLRRRRGRGRP